MKPRIMMLLGVFALSSLELFLMSAVSFADIIYLKNGNNIEGKIEDESETKVTVRVPGLGVMILGTDEIKSIDKKPINPSVDDIQSKDKKPIAAGMTQWNSANIQWLSFEDGLAVAKRSKRPVCLIFYTTWCPHCANYAKVFHNPEVVKKAKSFVMIRIDQDKNPALSKQYSPDGSYIPRTFFLSPDGRLDKTLTSAQYPPNQYLYHESLPGHILGGMDRALKKFRQ